MPGQEKTVSVITAPPTSELMFNPSSVTVEIDTEYRRPWLAWLDRTTSRLFGTARAGEAEH